MLKLIRNIRRALLRRLKLRPINSVFRKLRHFDWKRFDTALEVFGYTGEYHTMNYIHLVNELHIWEWSPECEKALKKNLPTAHVLITDSYREIEKINKKFDLLIIDNHQGIFGDNYCEHFEMLPKVFPVLKARSVVIMNILPDINELKKMYPGSYGDHIQRRANWYGIDSPVTLDPAFVHSFYTDYCERKGFQVEFIFTEKRNKVVSYLVIGLNRKS